MLVKHLNSPPHDAHGARQTSSQVELLGPGDTLPAEPLDFDIVNDNAYHVSRLASLCQSFLAMLDEERARGVHHDTRWCSC